jgi:hypothetical protein
MGDSLTGRLSVTFPANKTFREFCQKHFDNYDADQHEPIAIRFYKGEETIVTLFALDKFRQEGTNYNTAEKVPVKKFKSSRVALIDVLAYIEEFNFTLGAGNYDLDEMQVINK